MEGALFDTKGALFVTFLVMRLYICYSKFMEYFARYFEFVIHLLDVFIFYRLTEAFFTSKITKWKRLGLLAVLYIALDVRSVIEWSSSSSNRQMFIIVLIIVLSILYLIIAYEGEMIHKVLCATLFYAILSFSELAITVGAMFLEEQTYTHLTYSTTRIIALLFSRLLLLYLLVMTERIVTLSWRAYSSGIKKALTFLFALFVVVLFEFILFRYIDLMYTDLPYLIITSGIFLIALLMLTLGATLFHVSRRDFEEILQKQYMESQEQMNNNMELVSRDLRKLRHDMKNHLGVIAGLNKTKQYEELSNYLDGLYGEIERADDLILIPSNIALSVILNNKRVLAKEKLVDFRYSIQGGCPPLSDIELCSLLGNVIDNAIEASVKLPEEERWIELKLQELESGWRLRCRNPFLEKPKRANKRWLTSKNQKDEHGIGTITMESITKLYKGTIDYHISDHVFLVAIFIPQGKEG